MAEHQCGLFFPSLNWLCLIVFTSHIASSLSSGGAFDLLPSILALKLKSMLHKLGGKEKKMAKETLLVHAWQFLCLP